MLQVCSSRPREFSPKLASAPADQQAFEAAHVECRLLLADGKLDSSGRLASSGGLALVSATVIALPFVAVAVAGA